MLTVKVNGRDYLSKRDETVLTLCQKNRIPIPYLCYHPDLEVRGNCRVCVVEIDGKILSACNTKVHDGMQVITESPQIESLRKMVVELMLGNSPKSLLQKKTELSNLAKKLGIHSPCFNQREEKFVDTSTDILVFDNNKCISCGQCIQKCQIVQEVFAIGYSRRGHHMKVGSYLDRDLAQSVCVFCGQCSLVCPSGAIMENDEISQVMSALKDPTKHVVIQTAPSIRASIGETQGMPVGSKVTGKLVTCLKRMGFDRVFDTGFGADLTIVEEATELIKRIQSGGPLPLITSCSPGWVLYIEHFFSEYLPLLSTCKSPMQMTSAVIKTYYAQKSGIDPKDIVSVAIMPCVAKKFEARRSEMCASSYQDTDYVLTTREAGEMISESGIDFAHLPDTPFDPVMGESTGAAMIFAATGGVMEAALRYAADKLENKELKKVDYCEVRGCAGIKEARFEIAGNVLGVGVANGLGNARKLLGLMKEDPKRFQCIEIMACRGGCIGGGGQPHPTTFSIIKERTKTIYTIDKNFSTRKSQQNFAVKKLYRDFLGEPGGHKAHQLLHTHYTKRNCQ